MANSKISALTSASTPLAGTEILPIVQAGATVKVPTNDLTVRNIRAAATTGILQVSGPTAGTTRTATVPDANWTAARTDAAQSFTGDQTFATGNLVVGNGKGIDFSATPGSGTSELLNDYEEGAWTPVISGVALTISLGKYTKVGRTVFVETFIRYPVTVDATNVEITGLPFTPVNGGNVFLGAVVPANSITAMTKSFVATTGIQPVTAANARITNASFSGTDLQIGGWYSA